MKERPNHSCVTTGREKQEKFGKTVKKASPAVGSLGVNDDGSLKKESGKMGDWARGGHLHLRGGG